MTSTTRPPPDAPAPPDPLPVTQNGKKAKTRRLHVQEPEKSQTQKYY